MEKAEPTANPTRVPTGPPINVPTAVESATEPPVHQTFKGGSFEPPYRKYSTKYQKSIEQQRYTICAKYQKN